MRDLPDWGKGEGGVLLNGELSGSLETKSDSKTKQRRLQDKAEKQEPEKVSRKR